MFLSVPVCRVISVRSSEQSWVNMGRYKSNRRCMNLKEISKSAVCGKFDLTLLVAHFAGAEVPAVGAFQG